MTLALFDRDSSGALVPRDIAASGWGEAQMRGLAVSGALARGVEAEIAALGRDGLRPARWTLDLFRPVGMAPIEVVTEVVRAGRRLCLVDAVLRQHGKAAARASALYLAPNDAVNGRVWSPESGVVPPPGPECRAEGLERLYRTDATDRWQPPWETPQDASRTHAWQYPVPLVTGEELTPFQALAGAADVANAALNMGTRGLEYINADVTLHIARLPRGLEVGMSSSDRVEGDGVMTGVVSLYDREGVLGLAAITGLANPAAAVDLRRFGAHTV
ncbi:acyl-CoA thioesterase domain-containing protein [Gordonia sp. FQ]|uniref:acyl-CoA thioesterase domain-containing protein n=1 Tax=Gordonia sp. FQ TaxID=3446634 RepID=UPI003F85B296